MPGFSRLPAGAALGATLLVLACSGEADQGLGPADLEGDLTVLVADRPGGTSQTSYLLTTPEGRRVPLAFLRPPNLPSGTPIRVWGRDAATGGLDVLHVEATDGDGALTTFRRALRDGTPLPARSFAFVLLDTGKGVNISNESATQLLFDAGYFAPNRGSIRHFYQELSYGRQDVTGTVVGPLSFSPASACDPDGALALRAQVDALVGGPVTNYLWYFGSTQAGCAWEGLATLGSPDRPTRDSWYNASSSCVVLAQEPGHNFGMQHSSALRCPGKTFVDDPTGACTHVEYGDVFDPMGSACRHTNGWQKQYQGWLGGCNSVRVSASGTFTLLPLESACDGIQMLQIPMAHTRNFSYMGMSGFGSGATVDELTYYYVELRAQAAGFDQGLAPQVQVRAGGDYRPTAQSGLHTWLLDMNPATNTFTDAALTVGRTFTDPAGGVTITATAVTATSATIAVTIEGGEGAPTCLDGTTIVPPGPSSCAGTGAGGSVGSAGAGGAGGDALGGAGGDARSADGGPNGGGSGSPGQGAGCHCQAAPTEYPIASVPVLVAAMALGGRRRRRPPHRRGPSSADFSR